MPYKDPEKQREAERRYRAMNIEQYRERHRELARRWYEAHRDQSIAKSQAWNAANPEKTREATRKWRAANPEHDRKRGRKRDRSGRVWSADALEKKREYMRDYHARLRYGPELAPLAVAVIMLKKEAFNRGA